MWNAAEKTRFTPHELRVTLCWRYIMCIIKTYWRGNISPRQTRKETAADRKWRRWHTYLQTIKTIRWFFMPHYRKCAMLPLISIIQILQPRFSKYAKWLFQSLLSDIISRNLRYRAILNNKRFKKHQLLYLYIYQIHFIPTCKFYKDSGQLETGKIKYPFI